MKSHDLTSSEPLGSAACLRNLHLESMKYAICLAGLLPVCSFGQQLLSPAPLMGDIVEVRGSLFSLFEDAAPDGSTVWDASVMMTFESHLIQVLPVEEAEGGASFPMAEFCALEDDGEERFYSVTDSLAYWGRLSTANEVTAYDNPEVLIPFPFGNEPGEVSVDAYSYSTDGAEVAGVLETQHLGVGKLILPNGQEVDPVHQIRISKTTTSTYEGEGFTLSSYNITTQFRSSDFVFPHLEMVQFQTVITEADGSTFTTGSASYGLTYTSGWVGIGSEQVSQDMEVWPNPVHAGTPIHVRANGASNFIIVDAFGGKVWEEVQAGAVSDVLTFHIPEDLALGTYILMDAERAFPPRRISVLN